MLERFRGADLSTVADRARRSFGDDVMILPTRHVRDGGVPMVEDGSRQRAGTRVHHGAQTLRRCQATGASPYCMPVEPTVRQHKNRRKIAANADCLGAGYG